ncbi:hypothetical protein Tco_1326796 [Tanacetum coccineum]
MYNSYGHPLRTVACRLSLVEVSAVEQINIAWTDFWSHVVGSGVASRGVGVFCPGWVVGAMICLDHNKDKTVAVPDVPGYGYRMYKHDHDGSKAPDGSPDLILSSEPKPLRKHWPPAP